MGGSTRHPAHHGRTAGVCHKHEIAFLSDGASRTRTGDLLGAIQALSQRYGRRLLDMGMEITQWQSAMDAERETGSR